MGFCLFFEAMSQIAQASQKTLYVAEDDLNLLVFLPILPQC